MTIAAIILIIFQEGLLHEHVYTDDEYVKFTRYAGAFVDTIVASNMSNLSLINTIAAIILSWHCNFIGADGTYIEN